MEKCPHCGGDTFDLVTIGGGDDNELFAPPKLFYIHCAKKDEKGEATCNNRLRGSFTEKEAEEEWDYQAQKVTAEKEGREPPFDPMPLCDRKSAANVRMGFGLSAIFGGLFH